jgi:cupin 2 domain-containing protein
MTPSVCNLLFCSSSPRDAEMSETLITGHGIRIERIVSLGHASPVGFWYEQEEAEWVMVLAGRARLTIEGESEDRVLEPGVAAFLPPRCRHRVAWTDPVHPTIWLALYIGPELKPSAAGPMFHSEVKDNTGSR